MSQNKWYRMGAVLVCGMVGLGVYMVSTGKLSMTFPLGKTEASKMVQTPYGALVVTEPVLIELIDCPAMERIKHVYQYGVRSLVDGYGKNYTRYDHCVGVWALLRMHGASLEEQVAGLLHDASHTVFSHVGDYLFKQADCKDSYQDDIHAEYLEKQGVGKILSKYGMRIEDVASKDNIHNALDQDLPDLCADRIEYNIQEGLMAGLLNQDDVQEILAHLKFENGKWFLTDVAVAAKLARVSLYGTRHIWGGPDEFLLSSLTTQALRRALEIQLITLHDIHYSIDDVVWQKLCQSRDATIIDLMAKVRAFEKQCEQADQHVHDFYVRSKFRGVDPLVKTGNGSLKRLTELDDSFIQDYTQLKTQLAQGWYIKFIAQDRIERINDSTLTKKWC